MSAPCARVGGPAPGAIRGAGDRGLGRRAVALAPRPGLVRTRQEGSPRATAPGIRTRLDRPTGRLSAALVVALVVGAMAFGWPLFLRPTSGMPSQLAPTVFAVALVLVLAVVLAELSGGRMDSRTLAMLGVLAAVGPARRASKVDVLRAITAE